MSELKFGTNDTEERILERVYAADSKIMAHRDAEIKKQMDKVSEIDPTASNYMSLLGEYSSRIVKTIPLQSRSALSHYVARRKLILELFQKALDHVLDVQSRSPRNIDEKILHNILFQQGSDDTENSDLWLLSEEYVFFRGTSEARLKDVMVNGESLFREELTPEEMAHVESFNENRLTKRPDILLFPEEGKCIIIELKNPSVNVSDHLSEVNRYAGLIYGLSKPKFGIRTFYGYLIGDQIDPIDVRTNDSDFRESHSLGYLFRPHKNVFSPFNKLGGDGDLYTEVISYRKLLERAKLRNQMFIDRLMGVRG